MNALAQDIQSHWAAISPILSIRNEAEYDRAIERFNTLLDEIGTDEQHPLYELMDTLGTVLHAYEEKHHPMPECMGVALLRFLLEEHGLTASDLPEIGSQNIVSEILEGKRELTARQIRALAERFHVSPAVFI